VIWSREDDIQQDMWRPLAAQRVEVGLDGDGNIVGWRHRVVAQSYIARAIPPLFEKMGGMDVVSASGGEFRYAVPSHQVDYIRAARGIEVGAWRGVGSGYTKFAIETMMDEIAAQKGVEPLALRLELLQKEPRSIAVLKTVAEMSRWGEKRGDGHALGDSRTPMHSTPTQPPLWKHRSTSRLERSASIICGRRLIQVSLCSRKTSWRRWKAR
jgi:isoquinoline 1-oxidoreductase subunit beta